MGITWFALSVLAGKTFVVMVYLLVLYRLIGKREIAQMNAYDLVTIMALANAVQNAMTQGSGNLVAGLVTSGTLILGAYFITRLFMKTPGRERLLLGQPVVLISDGKYVEEALRHERVTRDEMKAALRQHGLVSPLQVALAVLEVDGSISIIPKGQTNTKFAELQT